VNGGEAPEEPAEDAEPAGESRQMSERTAKILLLVVVLGIMWGIVTVFPWVAYFVAGILTCIACQRIRGRFTNQDSDEGPAGETPAEPAEAPLITEQRVVQALHRMAAPHVFLSSLAADLDLSKEAARAVLEELEIPIRRAVRVGESTGVGVHKDDLPPLPHDPVADPVDAVDQEQPTNQQAGVRVERTDGGLRIYDLTDVHRHHSIK
jgi:hypothetical protein